MAAQRTAMALLAAILTATMISSVRAHGYMAVPAPRNLLNVHAKGFYNEMSLNSPGSGICGGMNAKDSRFSAGGAFASRQITGRYTEGGIMNTQIQIWNNHWGYFEMRLCPLSNPSTAAEKQELSDNCLQMHRLKQLGGGGYLHWIYHGLAGARFVEKASWRLPAGVTCARCVLQWRWVTAHMCRLPGINPYFVAKRQPNIRMCPKNYLSYSQYPPEKFINCADISISRSKGR